jgi:ankyrin repeat protein
MFIDKPLYKPQAVYVDCDIDDHYIVGSFISPTDLHSIHDINGDNVLTLSIDYLKKMLANNQTDDIRYILECDTETRIYTNMTDADGDSFLHLAIYADKYNIAELLLSFQASPHKSDKMKQTPIFRSVFVNNPAYIGLLVRYGADINACDVDGNTVLHIAVLENNIVIIKELLDHGANPHIQNNEGLYAIDYIRSSEAQNKLIRLFTNHIK